ncbi:hypothetical protein, partial [Diplocloster agilis]
KIAAEADRRRLGTWGRLFFEGGAVRFRGLAEGLRGMGGLPRAGRLPGCPVRTGGGLALVSAK